MTGNPAHTTGTLTVTTLCTEAGISRATSYRSPLSKIIAELLRTPDAPPRPQTDTLTADIARLKKADRTLRSQHAAEQREARATIAAYANHIQALSLRNAELEAENAWPRPHPVQVSVAETLGITRPDARGNANGNVTQPHGATRMRTLEA
ncbi:hypothetical protein ACFZDK_45635 [Streptomyces sp. NPDC007901]|uniref:hypothetical protein n=1 Tax=Streptomyces sp. NPDC007901 TaxID=3364785 RepID=UPI0036EBF65F